MRRIAISVAVIGGVVVAARALVPKLHTRMLATCNALFEEMPEDFPPKRMLGGIEEIRANTTRLLELLDDRKRTDVKEQEAAPRLTAEDDAQEVEMVLA